MSSEFSDELPEQLADIPGLTGAKTSMLGDLTGTGTSFLDHVLTASHIPTDGIIFQLIRDNPKLLLNPEIRRLMIRMLEAAGRHEMDSFSDTYDVNEIIALLKVNYQKHVYRMHHKKQSSKLGLLVNSRWIYGIKVCDSVRDVSYFHDVITIMNSHMSSSYKCTAGVCA